MLFYRLFLKIYDSICATNKWNEDFITQVEPVMIMLLFCLHLQISFAWASKGDRGRKREYSNLMDVTDPVYWAVNDKPQWAG